MVMPRGIVIGLSVALGAVVVGLLTVLLNDTELAAYVLDYHDHSLFKDVYPFTIQNLMHVIFFGALGDLLFQWLRARREHQLVEKKLLPEQDDVVLQAAELVPIRRRLVGPFDEGQGLTPYLIDLCILRFQASGSVEQTAMVLGNALDLITHRVDLRYSLSRYVSWLLPTIGFIGTVVGIAETLRRVDPEQPDLAVLTGTLGVAFSTTLVALFLSAVLVLVQHVVQGRDELAANRAGAYVLRNLVNRLYVAHR